MNLNDILDDVLDEGKDKKKTDRAKMCKVCGKKHKQGNCRLGFDEVK